MAHMNTFPKINHHLPIPVFSINRVIPLSIIIIYLYNRAPIQSDYIRLGHPQILHNFFYTVNSFWHELTVAWQGQLDAAKHFPPHLKQLR